MKDIFKTPYDIGDFIVIAFVTFGFTFLALIISFQ